MTHLTRLGMLGKFSFLDVFIVVFMVLSTHASLTPGWTLVSSPILVLPCFLFSKTRDH